MNPAHLVVMTSADNGRRQWERGTCRKGHPFVTRPDGKRRCQTCQTAYATRWREARAAS